jgi:hypothetical protein
MSFFQDDVFPNTIDFQHAYLTAQDWFDGRYFDLKFINLQPENMEKCKLFQKFIELCVSFLISFGLFLVTDILEIEKAEEASKPQLRQNSKEKFDSQKGKDLYDPSNLNEGERKIINSMLQRATLFYKDKSDEESDNDDWVIIEFFF